METKADTKKQHIRRERFMDRQKRTHGRGLVILALLAIVAAATFVATGCGGGSKGTEAGVGGGGSKKGPRATAFASAAIATYSNGFEEDTGGWFPDVGTITRQKSGYENLGGYGNKIESASGSYHARLDRGTCTDETAGGGPAVNCPGPYTLWGGENTKWTGGYTTQVDIYLDVAYAKSHRETAGTSQSGPAKACLEAQGGSTDAACFGTRFDFTSVPNDSNGKELTNFGFSISTGLEKQGEGVYCEGFTINTGTNVNRAGSNPTLSGKNGSGQESQCINTSGWYTFKHTFQENTTTHNLQVVMEIIPVGSTAATASWTVESTIPISSMGCNRYGWFSNQEIYGLAIDNASMTGCGTPPVVPAGKISPTGTTCQQYSEGAAATLGQLQYTTKGTKINAVSPGVFFYYTKVPSGAAGDSVKITQEHTGEAPDIPIQQGQVVLYDERTCKVVKWQPEVTDGTATGKLPRSGSFIIGVKYSPSALKGKSAPDPPTITYTFGTALKGEPIVEDKAAIKLVKK